MKRRFNFRRPVRYGEAEWVRTSRYRRELRICRCVLALLFFLFIVMPMESCYFRIVQWSILGAVVACFYFTVCDLCSALRSGRWNLPGLLYLFWLLFVVWIVFGFSWWVDTIGGLFWDDRL